MIYLFIIFIYFILVIIWINIIWSYDNIILLYQSCLLSADIMALEIPLRKKNRAKILYLLGPRIWSKIDASIKNVKTSLLRKIFYFICKANSNNYHILMIDIIILFSQSNFVLFVIIAILLSFLSYFNLVFPLILNFNLYP